MRIIFVRPRAPEIKQVKIQRSCPLRDRMYVNVTKFDVLDYTTLLNPARKLHKLNEFTLFRNFLFSAIFYILEFSLRVVCKKSVDGASVRQEAFI